MSVGLVVMLVMFIVLLALSVPMCFAIGVSSLSALLINGLPLQILPQRIFAAVDAFTLLPILLFILCGDLMLTGGIARSLIELCRNLVGWITGGMAYITILASMFFGAISGSSLATTRTIGGTMFPELVRSGYKPAFAAAIGATGGTLGILIPPSIAFVVFGTQTGTSVVRLFMGGAVAGTIVGILYMVAARVELMFDKTNTQKSEVPTLGMLFRSLKGAFWGLLAPVIILGGIYTGVFTATEAAVVAVVYCVIVEAVVYKDLTVRKFCNICINSATSAAILLFLIAVASLYSWVMTIEGMAHMLKDFVAVSGLTPLWFLFIVNVIYIVLGMLIDTTPIIILTAPIFFPVASFLGIDPVQFGIITVVNLAYGLITPPFGICVFMAKTYSDQSVLSIVKYNRMFYVFGLLAIFIVTYLPMMYMWVFKI